eukprot:6471039-Amphidinium_carterae.1
MTEVGSKAKSSRLVYNTSEGSGGRDRISGPMSDLASKALHRSIPTTYCRNYSLCLCLKRFEMHRVTKGTQEIRCLNFRSSLTAAAGKLFWRLAFSGC